MTGRWSLAPILGGLLLVLTAASSQEPAPAPAEPVTRELPERFAAWLEEVEPLLLSNERRVFLSLSSDYQREAFIDRFWRVRDPHPESARNELKVRYTHRVEQARALYGGLDDDRSKIYLIHGPPSGKIEIRCSGAYKPAEVWLYEGSEQVRFSVVLIFTVPREGPARIWHPSIKGMDPQLDNAARCINGDQLRRAAASIRDGGLDWELAFRRMVAKPRPNSEEWLATFQALSTDVPDGAATFEAEITFGFPARYQHRTVTQGLIAVPVEAVAAGDHLGFRSYNFELTGEVVLDNKLFENFRYKFAFPQEEFDRDVIPLAFQRYLRPGIYELVLKLEDTNGDRFFRYWQKIEVPAVDGVHRPREGLESETARLFAEATAALSRGETSIKIVPPRGTLHKGFVRFDTLAVGREIAKVAFVLDSERRLTRTRPPWNMEIDLGEFPRPHTLRVEALDEAGAMVAYDEVSINTGSQSFGVKLLEPRRGVSYEKSLLARARVDVPEGRSLERVEFYLNEMLLATLYQEPFNQPMTLPRGEELTYVRAVAYLPDGTSAEDLVFVSDPGNLEQIDVQMVELYTTVLDAGGRPVSGLTRDDFEVFEDKNRQEVIKFEAVADQPIRAGILFDHSASMGPNLDAARIAALTFFRDAISPRDRAAVITFNRLPRLAVEFTNDLRLLGGGLAGLSAEGETALYDSVMFGLYYFTGIKGQRALLLLTDGKDEASRFSFEETLDYARRAGVTLYAIGLGLNDPRVKGRLSQLADETGGRAFFLDHLARLTDVYTWIQEELRSQYLLTYQSSNTSGDEEFREILVKLADRDLTARTLSGYYP